MDGNAEGPDVTKSASINMERAKVAEKPEKDGSENGEGNSNAESSASIDRELLSQMDKALPDETAAKTNPYQIRYFTLFENVNHFESICAREEAKAEANALEELYEGRFDHLKTVSNKMMQHILCDIVLKARQRLIERKTKNVEDLPEKINSFKIDKAEILRGSLLRSTLTLQAARSFISDSMEPAIYDETTDMERSMYALNLCYRLFLENIAEIRAKAYEEWLPDKFRRKNDQWISTKLVNLKLMAFAKSAEVNKKVPEAKTMRETLRIEAAKADNDQVGFLLAGLKELRSLMNFPLPDASIQSESNKNSSLHRLIKYILENNIIYTLDGKELLNTGITKAYTNYINKSGSHMELLDSLSRVHSLFIVKTIADLLLDAANFLEDSRKAFMVCVEEPTVVPKINVLTN